MSESTFYRLLADLILIVHFSFVSYVVLGLLFIWIGFFCRLRCVRNPYFRATHLLAMVVVVMESVLGFVCPLTTWERDLRIMAGDGEYYKTSFMQHWIHKVLFFDLEPETFTIIYCVFFLALLLSLILIRPRPPRWLRHR